MCLTIPGKVISLKNKEALIDFGRKKERAATHLINVGKGDYVIVQNGFVIKKMSKNQAKKILNIIKKI